MSASGVSPILAAESITVRYGRRTAVDEVSLAVQPGAVYALLGRNGAGKSSLVRCLLGELKPASGRASLLGRDSWRERAKALQEVGVVPEEPNAPPAATARQLSRFCSRVYRRWDGAGFAARLERFGVPRQVPFGQLSKGQRGQVALALALASSPRLLILDDPTLGLDAFARREVFSELIGDLADRGTTVFLATHELAAVEGIATHVGVLDAGRLVLDEELESLKRRFRRIILPARPAPLAVSAGGEGSGGGASATDRAGAGQAILAPFAPLRSTARPWGSETVVAAYDQQSFEHLRGGPLGGEAEATSLTLEEIFVALVATGGRHREREERGDPGERAHRRERMEEAR